MTKYFSFIIPTFNSEKYLRKTLKSIEMQDFDKAQYEIIIADGGSTDNTLKIIEKFKGILPIKLVKNKKVDAESGKYLAFKSAKGKILILLDSDNEIVYKNWLSEAKKIFDRHPEIWGLESPWLTNKKDVLINQYFSMMKMTDPVARLFKPTKERITDFDNYEIVTVKATDTPVTGANGFFWRRSLVKTKINETNKFEETNYVAFLVSKGNVTFARFRTNGIYHYYCDTFSGFLKKRIKIANKFIDRKEKHQATWIDRVGYFKLFLSLLYNFTLIGPIIEVVYQIIKTKNIGWIYHPASAFFTVTIYGFYYVKRSLIK